MIFLFLWTALISSITIHKTGAWEDESSRLHDMVAFVLLAHVIWLLALIFQPFVPPSAHIEFICIVCEPWRYYA